MHTFAKVLVMAVGCALGVMTFAHPQVRLRFNVWLFISVIAFGAAGCTSTPRHPYKVEDGGVNMDGTHEARCAVQRDGDIILTPYGVDCHE